MKIRLWKLGSLEHKILPSYEAVKKLQECLANPQIGPDGVVDLVWDAGLTCQVIDSADNDEIIQSRTQEDHNHRIMRLIAEAHHAELVQDTYLWKKELGRAAKAIQEALTDWEGLN